MMDALRRFADSYPVTAYVLLCFLITWSVWFSIPTVAGDDWTLIKIFTGAGIGPGMAAVLLDRLRRGWNENDFTRSWWTAFVFVAAIVIGLDIWSLMAGDGPTLALAASAEPAGLSLVGVAGALISAALAGFVFATARSSRSKYLNSITRIRVKPYWWMVALLLPALVYTMGIGAAIIFGSQLPDPPLLGAEVAEWAPFVVRAALFTYFVVCVGEEPGWRGYMLPELQARYSPLVATIILGAVWGVWHFPLFVIGLYSGDPLAGTLFYVVFTTSLAVLFTWLFNGTGGILSLTLMLHLAINTTPKILPVTWWAGVALLLLAGYLIYRSTMWRRGSMERRG